MHQDSGRPEHFRRQSSISGLKTIIEDSVQIGCFKHHFKMAGGILFNFRKLCTTHLVDHSFMINRDVAI